MKSNILLLTLFSLLLMNCEKSDVTEIKQLKIDLFSGGGSPSTLSSDGIIFESQIKYKDFNIGNYKNCSKIIFIASIKSSEANNDCYLELYNLTDDIEISNSLVSTNTTELEWVESDNLIGSFPNKNIDLSLKLKTQNDGIGVSLRSASIYVYF